MLRNLFSRFLEVLRDGCRIWLLVPIIPALAIIPELAQHLIEINSGMFESRDAAVSLASSSIRWAFGYAKVALFLLAILATIRHWGSLQTAAKWRDLSAVGWRNVLLAVVLMALTGIPQTFFGSSIGEQRAALIGIALSLMTMPLIVLLVHGLAGNRTSTLSGVFRGGWFASLRIIVFSGLVWLPLQLLHAANHEWAFGSSQLVVWSLMIFDSLIVGLLATMAGTAMHHGSLPLRKAVAPAVGRDPVTTQQ